MVKKYLRRVPFTIAMTVGLVLVAILTQTHNARISEIWLARLGFAPNDLWLLRIERIFTSAMVTYGGRVFWEALAMFIGAVGVSEWLTSTRRAAFTFWGVHLLVLVAESLLIALPLSLWGGQSGIDLGLERDVGASVGYFACLGLVCALLPGRWRWISAALVMGGLVFSLFLPPWGGESKLVKLSADIAHLLAFPLGWLSYKLGRKTT